MNYSSIKYVYTSRLTSWNKLFLLYNSSFSSAVKNLYKLFSVNSKNCMSGLNNSLLLIINLSQISWTYKSAFFLWSRHLLIVGSWDFIKSIYS